MKEREKERAANLFGRETLSHLWQGCREAMALGFRVYEMRGIVGCRR